MSKKNPAVLGVFVTDAGVEGVLLRRSNDGKVHIVGRYVKQRARRGERVGDLAAVIPGLRESTVSDYTMEIGDGSGRGGDRDIFLSSELDELGVKKSDLTEKRGRRETTPFGPQLREILAECRQDGFPAPQIAFCLGSSEVMYHEVGTTVSREKSQKRSVAGFLGTNTERKALLTKALESAPSNADKGRVEFVPMTGEGQRERYLAVIPLNPDPVTEAIDAVSKRSRVDAPSAHVVDAEATLLAGLVRRQPDTDHGVVGIVRVSQNDTTVMFIKEGKLDRYEHLRSLTSYDPVDTVCSRVLLKQDELKIGRIDMLYVSTEHHGEDAIKTFRGFFPDTDVHLLQDTLAHHNLEEDDKLAQLRPQTLPALGVALRQLEGWTDKDRRGAHLVNLLPKKRRGATARKKSPIRWHVYAAAAVLFVVSLFYTWRFLDQQQEIDRREAEVVLNPPDFPDQSPDVLRARVDSLNAVSARYSRSLHVLDSLLVGSDQWSSSLAKMTVNTRDIGRIWLKGWSPNGAQVRVEGNSLERSRIARLAQLWNGSIDQLTFAEIQGIRVYSFMMTVPIEQDLPQVAQFLRENSLRDLEPSEMQALEGLAEASRHATN